MDKKKLLKLIIALGLLVVAAGLFAWQYWPDSAAENTDPINVEKPPVGKGEDPATQRGGGARFAPGADKKKGSP